MQEDLAEIDLNQGSFELLKACVRLLHVEPKAVQSVVNVIFELGSVRIMTREGLISREKLSQNSLEMVLMVERYLRNRPDFSKAKLDLICREILPQ